MNVELKLQYVVFGFKFFAQFKKPVSALKTVLLFVGLRVGQLKWDIHHMSRFFLLATLDNSASFGLMRSCSICRS